jgi:hypothetical protein
MTNVNRTRHLPVGTTVSTFYVIQRLFRAQYQVERAGLVLDAPRTRYDTPEYRKALSAMRIAEDQERAAWNWLRNRMDIDVYRHYLRQ